MTNIPDNPATSLERIFTRVRESGQSSVMNVWIKVLNAQAGTPEFAMRHAEVVLLVKNLQMYLLSQPEDDPTRVRYEGDIGAWYTAVSHTGNWSSDSNAHLNMIDEDKVRLLGSLGEILSLRASIDQASKPDVEALRSSLADWRSLLEDAEVPSNLAAKIRVQVEQIEFLLDEIEIYGYEPLAEHGRTLFGLGLSVIKVTGKLGKVATAMTGIFEFITAVSIQDFGTAASVFGGVLSSVSEVFTLASEEENLKAITAKDQKALTQKPDESGDVVEAEVIEDYLPDGPNADEGQR